MAVVTQTCASLRIWGDDLVPDEVTALLGSAPTVARRKGEPMQKPPTHPPSRTGFWSIQTERAQGDALDLQINSILSPLTADVSVWSSLAVRFEMDMFCGVWLDKWNQGASLSPATLKLLGDRGIPLEFDIYFDRRPHGRKVSKGT